MLNLSIYTTFFKIKKYYYHKHFYRISEQYTIIIASILSYRIVKNNGINKKVERIVTNPIDINNSILIIDKIQFLGKDYHKKYL